MVLHCCLPQLTSAPPCAERPLSRPPSKQPSGSLASTDTPPRTPNAPVQIAWAGTAVSFGPWPDQQSLPPRTVSSVRSPLSHPPHSGFCDVARRDGASAGCVAITRGDTHQGYLFTFPNNLTIPNGGLASSPSS